MECEYFDLILLAWDSVLWQAVVNMEIADSGFDEKQGTCPAVGRSASQGGL